MVRLYDVGVAGIHRLHAHKEYITQASVIIAIATTTISLIIYRATGDIYLDRSRPGYIAEDEKHTKEDDNKETESKKINYQNFLKNLSDYRYDKKDINTKSINYLPKIN